MKMNRCVSLQHQNESEKVFVIAHHHGGYAVPTAGEETRAILRAIPLERVIRFAPSGFQRQSVSFIPGDIVRNYRREGAGENASGSKRRHIIDVEEKSLA